METRWRPWPVEHSPTSTGRASLVLVTWCLASLPAVFAWAATLPFHLAHSVWRQSQHSVMAGTKPGNWDPDWIRRQRDWNHLFVVTLLFKLWSISFQSYVLRTENTQLQSYSMYNAVSSCHSIFYIQESSWTEVFKYYHNRPSNEYTLALDI